MAKKKAILAIGCSHTMGDGLRGFKTPRDGVPSPFAWPGVLASRTGLEVVNLSGCGWSNMEITDKFLRKYDPDKFAAVVAVWSYIDRVYIRDASGRLSSRIPTDVDRFPELATYYTDIHDDYVTNLQLAGNVALVNTIAKIHGPVLHDFVDPYAGKRVVELMPIKLVDAKSLHCLYDCWEHFDQRPGEQGHHFCEDAHAKFVDDYLLPQLKRYKVV